LGTKRISGSKLNFFFLKDKLATKAGAFNENEGIIEKPLFVKPTDPEKVEIFLVLSVD
jgi:hypothetical protein